MKCVTIIKMPHRQVRETIEVANHREAMQYVATKADTLEQQGHHIFEIVVNQLNLLPK